MPTVRRKLYPSRARQGWCCFVILFVCTMVLLMGRAIQVRSWIPAQSHRWHSHRREIIDRVGVVSERLIAARSNSHAVRRSSWNHVRDYRSSSSRLFATKFNVGESVSVKIADNSLVSGIIQEARGGGWYSVQVQQNDTMASDAINSIIKCRTPQMGRLSHDDDSSGGMQQSSTSNTATTSTTITNVQMFSAPNPTRPIVHPEAGQKPEFPPPAPTIYDLDAALLDRVNISNRRDQELLEQVQYHSNYDKWVVFTDLHCSPASLDTCLKVLARVHELAVERDAGVLFLGDFWHHRGYIRVDCLNSVLEHFRDWTVPMIMIPGNHDQVTLDGHSHGLTPFENAYRVGTTNVSGPLVLSYPTKFRNALFVPHIRDVATMEAILQSQLAQEASALFVHAEVTGALMNDLIVSMHGIPPASFPVHKQIYSGHFHKPHTVKASNGAVRIEYLGSPYETTLSEAQQAKSLAILDAAADWKCIEYVPIDIGRRHFKVSSWDELSELQLNDTTQTTTKTTGSLDNSTIVRSGDRIVASIPQAEMDLQASEMNANKKVKELRTSGVMVEIREIKNTADQALGSSLAGNEANQLEEMSPESTWRAYIAEEEQQRKSLNSESAKILLDTGLEILQELEASDEVWAEQSKEVTELALTKVSVEGFGPFREKVTYPLANRGLVLLKGTNNDGGTDSNGTGKSSLAMAALWALTGSMDPRRAQDGKVSDVINDESKAARVTLDGKLNDIPFTISRTKTATKSNLVFLLDGEDLTTQSAKETQVLIEENLGVSVPILSRTMFHGQHAINDLLEATDAKLKEELSLLVPLGLWQAAASLSRAKSREAGKRASEFEGMITMRSQDMNRLALKRKEAERNVAQKEKNISTLEAEYNNQQSRAMSYSRQALDFQEIETMVTIVSSELEALEEKCRQIQAQRQGALAPLQFKLESTLRAHDSLLKIVQQGEREVYAATLNLNTRTDKVKEVEQKWSIDLSMGGSSNEISAPDICPTCRQPIASTGGGHSHEDLETIMNQEIDHSLERRNEAKEIFETASSKLEEQRLELKVQVQERISIESDLQTAELEWRDQLDQLERTMEAKRRERSELTDKIAAVARESQMVAKNEAATANIQRERASLDYAIETLANIENEMKEIENRLEEMQGEVASQTKRVRTMSELADRLGQRGVQTFVLQNVVEVLQSCSQTYLDDLSDGSQRLELCLDAGDRISRTALVVGADGVYKERALATLSGGQWRRCSLALTFGFAELVARRGKFRPSMCVLDEPLTHLDRSGRSKVGDVIRKLLRPNSDEYSDSGIQPGFGVMGMSTVVLILQDLAAEELDEAFDCIDEVIKENSASSVKVDGFHAS